MRGVEPNQRITTDGKFFRVGNERVFLRMATFGPFPPGVLDAACQPQFRRMATCGLHGVRLFEMPSRQLLDAALACGLHVFAGLDWAQYADFRAEPRHFTTAKVRLAEFLRELGGHPALAGVYVGNEIPPELVRWHGHERTREAIEELIALGKSRASHLLYAYASFPSTEYLEPNNADFTALNIYLEDPAALRGYLRRLQHIAGDRPLLVSEFGLDSRRNGLAKQAEAHAWAPRITAEEDGAGFTHYAWSDLWFNRGELEEGWDFGLVDREFNPKPALQSIAAWHAPRFPTTPTVAIIICTHNGIERIGACLQACLRVREAAEVIVVDDASDDGTAESVARDFPQVKLVRMPRCGLSAARNAGAAAATAEVLAYTDDDCEPDAEWVLRLRKAFASGDYAAVGGPNIPPHAHSWRDEAIVAAPGAASHVMLSDTEAEHLPGCNLAVRKAAFEAIGGFDEQFWTAGDDVDFCWRLHDAGYRLGFAPGAFVWHKRRASTRGYLRQQAGYGAAEKLLRGKHPLHFFGQGGASWSGRVYTGAPIHATAGDVIYSGPMARAGYQALVPTTMPTREPASLRAMLVLSVLRHIAPRIRSWKRNGLSRDLLRSLPAALPPLPRMELTSERMFPGKCRDEVIAEFLQNCWSPAGPTDAWDMCKGNRRCLIATIHGQGREAHTLVREM